MPELAPSAEQLRVQAIIDANGPETRKGAAARERMTAIKTNYAKDEQRNRGAGQFIQGISLKEKQAQRKLQRQ